MSLNSLSSNLLKWYQHPNPISFNPFNPCCDLTLFDLLKAELKSKFNFSISHDAHLKTILHHSQLSFYSNRPVKLSIKNQRALKSVLDWLESLEYIVIKQGRCNPKIINYSYLTKFQPTEKFKGILGNHSLQLQDIEDVRVINIKDEEGNVTDRIRLDGSTLDGKCIKLFNDFIKTHKVQCGLQSGDFDENHHLYGFTGNIFLNSQVARIYTGKEGVGGRLYNQGSLQVQHLSESIRKRITIDGEPTVELDFKAFHPSMIYHLEGLISPVDAYDIFPTDPNRAQLRECVKAAFNIFINSANIPEAVHGLTSELFSNQKELGAVLKQHYQSNPQSCVALLLKEVYKAHKPVKKWFCQAGWETLQNKDSDIMLLILMNLTKKGIPALPIHDSVIVPAKDAQAAHKVMKIAYKKVMGFDIQIEGLPLAA